LGGVIKPKAKQTLTLQGRYKKQCVSGFIPTECKMLFKFDEIVGYPIESISGAVYDPTIYYPDVLGQGEPENAGYVEFNVTNAIRIQNPTTEPRPVACDWDVTSSLDKILLLVAHIKTPYSNTGSRAAIGTLGYTNVLTVSLSGGMHIAFNVGFDISTGQEGEWIYLPADPTMTLPQDDEPRTLYVMWNGTTRELSAKVLNEDGGVYNNGVDDYAIATSAVNDISGVIPDFTETSVEFGKCSRYSNADHYHAAFFELDSVPDKLDYKLALWGRASRAGFKGAPNLAD
jgi:hypothetical protein